MKSHPHPTKETHSNAGMSFILSEKAFRAFLYVALVLGTAYLESKSSIHQEPHGPVLQNPSQKDGLR
jgi:hypothetical protein